VKAINDWLTSLANEFVPFAIVATPIVLYLFLRVFVRAGDVILARIDAAQNKLESIERTLEEMSHQISPRRLPHGLGQDCRRTFQALPAVQLLEN
jgi:hypothetical protein